jgi:hypothetical protein
MIEQIALAFIMLGVLISGFALGLYVAQLKTQCYVCHLKSKCDAVVEMIDFTVDWEVGEE